MGLTAGEGLFKSPVYEDQDDVSLLFLAVNVDRNSICLSWEVKWQYADAQLVSGQ